VLHHHDPHEHAEALSLAAKFEDVSRKIKDHFRSTWIWSCEENVAQIRDKLSLPAAPSPPPAPSPLDELPADVGEVPPDAIHVARSRDVIDVALRGRDAIDVAMSRDAIHVALRGNAKRGDLTEPHNKLFMGLFVDFISLSGFPK